jgi:hypothetical protein
VLSLMTTLDFTRYLITQMNHLSLYIYTVLHSRAVELGWMRRMQKRVRTNLYYYCTSLSLILYIATFLSVCRPVVTMYSINGKKVEYS